MRGSHHGKGCLIRLVRPRIRSVEGERATRYRIVGDVRRGPSRFQFACRVVLGGCRGCVCSADIAVKRAVLKGELPIRLRFSIERA